MRLLLFAITLLACGQLLAQRVVNVDKDEAGSAVKSFYTVGGQAFINEKYIRIVDGSPYFRDAWMRGLIVSAADQEYKDVQLRLDLLDNEIHYLDSKGNEYVSTTPVKEIVLTDTFGRNYRFINAAYMLNGEYLEKKWYQWISSGKASLYKEYSKNISEFKPYGSATTEQKINTKETYLINYNKAYFEIKKLKDAPSILANKRKDLEEFLKTKDDKNASMEDRFLALVTYYNSLFPEKK